MRLAFAFTKYSRPRSSSSTMSRASPPRFTTEPNVAPVFTVCANVKPATKLNARLALIARETPVLNTLDAMEQNCIFVVTKIP